MPMDILLSLHILQCASNKILYLYGMFLFHFNILLYNIYTQWRNADCICISFKNQNQIHNLFPKMSIYCFILQSTVSPLSFSSIHEKVSLIFLQNRHRFNTDCEVDKHLKELSHK